MMCKHKAQTNIDLYFGMKENEYKDARDFFCALPRTTISTTSSAANDYAPSSSCADDDMLLVLMIATPLRTPCSCLQPIRRELDFFFSEDRRSRRRPGCNQDGCQTGIEPGTL